MERLHLHCLDESEVIQGLNHVTLAVADLDRSLAFYTEILGLKGHVLWERGAYLSVGSLWLCLSLDKVCEKSDFTHLAFSVNKEDFCQCSQHLVSSGVHQWKENSSEGRSLYFTDPDGHKLEIHVGDLQSRLESLEKKPYANLQWL